MEKLFLISLIALLYMACQQDSVNNEIIPRTEDIPKVPDSPIRSVSFSYSEVGGIGRETDVTRRDPSDVIKVGDTYYVYYTRLTRNQEDGTPTPVYPAGYPGEIWGAKSTDEGHNWEEFGPLIVKGETGWDSFGVLTPGIAFIGGKYYVYYTAVEDTGFAPTPGVNGGVNTQPTRIGVAFSDNPEGPFVKSSENPLLVPQFNTDKFDNDRVDDSCIQLKYGKVFLYFKGRSTKNRHPLGTSMGLAVSDRGERGFVRSNNGNPVQESGHEVATWEGLDGFYSLATTTEAGPNGNALFYSESPYGPYRVVFRGLTNFPKAPGFYKPELTGLPVEVGRSKWGIYMMTQLNRAGKDLWLLRFETTIE